MAKVANTALSSFQWAKLFSFCLLLVASSPTINASNVTVIGTPSDRIVGGNAASAGEYPYYCRLVERDIFGNEEFVCGCSLFNDGWAITAAHCVVDRATNQVRTDMVAVNVGYYCDEPNNCCPAGATCPNHEIVPIQQIIIHPEFDMVTTLFDVALIRFTVTTTLPIQFVLPDDGSIMPALQLNDPVTAIGSGQITSVNSASSNRLQEVDMRFVPEQRCAVEWNRFSFLNSVVCAYVLGFRGGICYGDAGSPLLRVGAGPNNQDVVIGIHAFIGGTCELRNFPDVMASVASVFPWIRSNMCATTFGQRPYWCDRSVAAGPDSEPEQERETVCDESKNNRFIFNPISKQTKRCKYLKKKEQFQQLICTSALTDAREVCCETCSVY